MSDDTDATPLPAQPEQPHAAQADWRTINTQGGDYAEGSIDKRQGAFVEGGTVIGNVIGQQTQNYYQAPVSALDLQQQRNRHTMLAKVKVIWIDGLLKQSLDNDLRIALRLTEQPDAVDLPLSAVVQELNRQPRELPSDLSIITVFEQMAGLLLILGAPGAGKTTLLLELARDLVARAERYEHHPIPVVFNLSSWAAKRQPLQEWLAEELNAKYDVPRKVAQAWVGADMLVPLLDGLDEVGAEHRDDCVAAINTYRQEHGLVPLAVCSRIADYTALTTKLRLQGAVAVQPLSSQQVADHVERAGPRLAGVRTALLAHAEVGELLRSPLMLSVVMQVYADQSAATVQAADTLDEQRRQLFDAYIHAMFQRRSKAAADREQPTLRWLGWLAYTMSQQNQTIFLVDHLQPAWLPTRAMRVRYALLDRIGGGLLVGLLGGLLAALIVGPRSGLVGGLSGGLVALFFGGQSRIETLQQRRFGHTMSDALVGALVGGFVGGFGGGLVSAAVAGLVAGLRSGLIEGVLESIGYGLTGVLSGGLAGTLFGGLLGILAGMPGIAPRQVMLVERLRWVWNKAWKAGLVGLLVGLSIGLLIALILGTLYFVMGLLFDVFSRDQNNMALRSLLIGMGIGLGAGLALGSFFGVFVGLLGGLSSDRLPTRIGVNQGIWRSARSALLSGLIGGLIGALAVGLLAVLNSEWGAGLLVAAVGAVAGALVSALPFGGYTCLSHLALRWVLYRDGALPLRLIPFLDYCAERIFLRKVGGGYIFVHRLLMEHFATLYTERLAAKR